MARNRIIHNIQEVLVGSPSGESNLTVTSVDNYEILKRLEQVQSFSYDIGLEQSKSNVLGRSASIDNKIIEPPGVSLNLEYYLNGVVNEKRVGLNVANEESSVSDNEKNAAHYIVMESGRLNDKRNVYLITNSDARDIGDNLSSDYPSQLEKRYHTNMTKSMVAEEKATGYGVVIFQNCYLTSYSMSASVGSLATVSLGYEADGVIMESSADDKDIPKLNTKTATVEYSDKKFIVPKRFSKDSLLPKEGLKTAQSNRMDVTVQRRGDDGKGLKLHDNNIQKCDVSFDIDRKKISYFGHKLYVDHYPQLPVIGKMTVDYINYKDREAGNIFDNANSNHIYDAVLNFKDVNGNVCSSFTVSGARLTSYNEESSINGNKTSNISLSCEMSFEDNSRGVFISGVAGSALHHQLGTAYSTYFDPVKGLVPEELTDDDGNVLTASLAYPVF
tara:strand:+ start:346 stop:1680 length:1335 start_codon:yes stop_codon:yes gene_type:complete